MQFYNEKKEYKMSTKVIPFLNIRTDGLGLALEIDS